MYAFINYIYIYALAARHAALAAGVSAALAILDAVSTPSSTGRYNDTAVGPQIRVNNYICVYIYICLRMYKFIYLFIYMYDSLSPPLPPLDATTTTPLSAPRSR